MGRVLNIIVEVVAVFLIYCYYSLRLMNRSVAF